MAEYVFTNGYISINGVDLSDHARSVSLDYSAEMVDSTGMGDTTRERLGGLKDWALNVEFKQDHAAGEVDATLFPLVGSTFTVEVRPVNGNASATNPRYYGTGILEKYPPIGGGVGDLSTTAISILAAGDLTRGTTS